MLQKDPEKRPTAKDIFTHSLPSLTKFFKMAEEEEDDLEDNDNDAAKTNYKYVGIYM